MQNLVKHVSQRIRYLRKSANLTQEQLSELLDIDRSYIGKIERGEVNVSLDTLERIAVALKVDSFEFFAGHNNKPDNTDKKDIIEKINLLMDSQNSEELKSIYEMIRIVRSYKNIP
ncbi:helix-turn-helix domain-containing protein [Paenibacillus rhizoplanae]|uniref:Helix-turn-helix domain-containing protein n=1 Tax=Paenibacillus rhizoplanae TaxID=1917181 RepID=A0ABW5FAF5_9BACL